MRNGTISGYIIISINCPSALILSSIKENIVRIVDNPREKNIDNIVKFFKSSKNNPLDIRKNVENTIKFIKIFSMKANKIFDKQKIDKSIGILMRIRSPFGAISCLEIL